MSDKYSISQDGTQILREGVKIANRDPQTGTLDYLPDMDRFRAPVTQFLKEAGLDKPPAAPPDVAARQAVPRVAGEPIPELSSPPEPVVAFVPPPAAETREERAARLRKELAELEGPAPELTPEQQEIAELKAKLARLEGVAPARPATVTGSGKPLAAPVDLRVVHETQPGTGFVKPTRGDDFMDPLKLRTYPDAPKYEQGMGDKTPAFVDWLFANHPADAERRYFGRKLPGRSYEERMAEVRARQNTAN